MPRIRGRKSLRCGYCGKCYLFASVLETHRRTHTAEKPYTCETCQKSFSLKCSLINHKSIHTGEKPFQCETCQRSFSLKCNLIQHKKIHISNSKSDQTCASQKSFAGTINISENQAGNKVAKQNADLVKDPLTGRYVARDDSYHCDTCFIRSRLKILTLPKDVLMAL